MGDSRKKKDSLTWCFLRQAQDALRRVPRLAREGPQDAGRSQKNPQTGGRQAFGPRLVTLRDHAPGVILRVLAPGVTLRDHAPGVNPVIVFPLRFFVRNKHGTWDLRTGVRWNAHTGVRWHGRW
jgi:hypothetical protein